jgi:N6-L-threonylcarbamoyladenine synthase
MLVLGLETSCDETAASLLGDGRDVLSEVVSTQVDIHRRWGGVVPELASRNHVVQVLPVIDEALRRAGRALEEV